MKFNETLMTFVRKDLDKGLIPMLLGDPGIGKSSWLTALADLMHTQCFTLACNQLADKADLTGARLVPTDKGEYKQVFYPHAIIADAIQYALANKRQTPILFLDELNRTTPDVTSAALSIPTLRAIGSSPIPPNLRIVIAGNDKGNVTSLDEASLSRFVLYHVEPDVNTFLGLDKDLNPFVKNVLQANPDCIFCRTLAEVNTSNDDDDNDEMSLETILGDGEDMLQITTPRTISGVSNWLNGFNSQELLSALATTSIVDGIEINALQEAIEGHVGKTKFAALLLSEIANGINTTGNMTQSQNIGKPQCYDDMKACDTMTSLNDFITTMSDNDKSGTLLYALYEKEDNTQFIQALAPNITSLVPSDMKSLMQLSAHDQLDSDNVQVLSNTNTTIATTLNVILQI